MWNQARFSWYLDILIFSHISQLLYSQLYSYICLKVPVITAFKGFFGEFSVMGRWFLWSLGDVVVSLWCGPGGSWVTAELGDPPHMMCVCGCVCDVFVVYVCVCVIYCLLSLPPSALLLSFKSSFRWYLAFWCQSAPSLSTVTTVTKGPGGAGQRVAMVTAVDWQDDIIATASQSTSLGSPDLTLVQNIFIDPASAICS